MAQLLRKPTTGIGGSIATHIVVVGALLFAMRHHPAMLRPLHLPGTPQGKHLLLSYSLGGPAEAHQSTVVQAAAATPRHATLPRPSVQPAPVAPSAPVSEVGHGTAGDSAFGDENVRVALPKVHPRPQPDLSALPHGTAGDVVVDVVIDDTGKVTGATLVKGLSTAVDTTVVQALRDWTFTPATRNGQNIASEQEILIHYERG